MAMCLRSVHSLHLHCVQAFRSFRYTPFSSLSFTSFRFRSFHPPQHRTAKEALSLPAAIFLSMAFRVLAFAKANAPVLVCNQKLHKHAPPFCKTHKPLQAATPALLQSVHSPPLLFCSPHIKAVCFIFSATRSPRHTSITVTTQFILTVFEVQLVNLFSENLKILTKPKSILFKSPNYFDYLDYFDFLNTGNGNDYLL